MQINIWKRTLSKFKKRKCNESEGRNSIKRHLIKKYEIIVFIEKC